MIEVQEMNNADIVKLLRRVGYGHLACCEHNTPYIVPVHFAYDEAGIVIYTTEGKKSAIIGKNDLVCLQAEDIVNDKHWESVIVNGRAVRLSSEAEREKALALITAVTPTLAPAISIRWLDNWIRENLEVIYRIIPETFSGRRTVGQHGELDLSVNLSGGSKDRIY